MYRSLVDDDKDGDKTNYKHNVQVHVYALQGFPKLTKSYSHFSKTLTTTADIKSSFFKK